MIGGAGKSGAPLRQVDRAEAQRLVRAATQRLGSYQLARRPYEETWRELVRFIAPDRGRLNSQTPQPNDTRRARLQQTSILDRTGTKAVKDLAAFLQRGICSPARPWFRLAVSDQDVADDGAVRAWLDEVRVRMMAVFQASNFYTSMASVFAELGVFGTTAMIVVQDYNDVIRCHPLTIGEFYLATDARGRCGGLIRQYTMTVAQMVERFGRDACPVDVCQALDQGRVTEERVVCHSIERNEVKPGAPGWRGMPWRSLWWVLGRDDQVLEVGGFRVMPVISPRWDVVANDTYGHGPGEDALPDVKSLQVYARDRALAVAKMARPPMIGGGSLVSSQIDDGPGAINIFPGPGGNQLAPLYAMQPNLVTLDQGIQDLRNSIRFPDANLTSEIQAAFAESSGTVTYQVYAAKTAEAAIAATPTARQPTPNGLPSRRTSPVTRQISASQAGLGEHLPESIMEHLPGYRGMGPVRVGNQAAEHFQYDVYGNIILGAAQAFHDQRLLRRSGRAEFVHLEAVGEQAFRVHDQPDAGMWELRTRARIHTSSALMSWAACDRLAKVAQALGLADRVGHWRERAEIIRDRILREAWCAERQAFAESFGGRDLDASALLMAEVGFIEPRDPRFTATLQALETSLCDGPFMRRYEAPDDFGRPETAFNICTFWRIDALARIGRRDQAREIFELMLASRNPLGLLSEDTHAATGEMWGNFPQTYSMVGLINAAVRLSERWDTVI